MDDNGIVVVQIDPNLIEILTLAGDPREATHQIAEILNYPSDKPISGNVLRFTGRNPVEPIRPEEEILLWFDPKGREKGLSVNLRASGVARHGGQIIPPSIGSICGRAIFSGYNPDSRVIRSVPLSMMEYHLGMAGDHDASTYVRSWRKARGL